MKTYIAYSTEKRAYICEAKNKKQMKERGMNMRLDWQSVKDAETGKRMILCDGYELKNTTVLS